MSQENVETFLNHLGVYNRKDYDAALAYVAPDIEWAVPFVLVDVPATVRGHEEVRRVWALVDEAFGGFAMTPIETRDLGDRVMVHVRMVGTGRLAGVPTDMDGHAIIGFRDGLIARIELFASRAEALEAAGLSE